MADMLASRARFVGHAKIRGRLLNLGRYLGLIEPAGPDDWVRGDAFALPSDNWLAVLDRYEGTDNQPPLFVRRLGSIVLATGEELAAWYYLYQGPTRGVPVIASGEFFPSRDR
jgi:gamma-glutamylcyclotransferase (GGCT)/AIG2-like uncharacterized protein YtfP